VKRYKIKRSVLERLKKRYGLERETDREAIEWLRRNIWSGYEAFELVKIEEDD